MNEMTFVLRFHQGDVRFWVYGVDTEESLIKILAKKKLELTKTEKGTYKIVELETDEDWYFANFAKVANWLVEWNYADIVIDMTSYYKK